MFEPLYQELRDTAARLLGRERESHTLRPTDLVHEAYLRLGDDPEQGWASETDFRRLAAHVMRNVLVDHARARNTLKRGGRWRRITLVDDHAVNDDEALDLLALDQALTHLESEDPRAAKVVELRFFGGLTEIEIAESLGVTDRTVRREWTFGKAFLRSRLSESDVPPQS